MALNNDEKFRVQQLEFIVEPYLSGVRIDSFLARHLRNYTTWRLHRMVCAGMVRVNALRAERQQRVYRGQCVNIRVPEPPDKLLRPTKRNVEIVYEDPWLMVVNKPAGVVTHPVGEFQDGALTNILQDYLDAQTKSRGLLRPGIVHRLDRMTSGLLVVPKEHLSHRLLSLDFQRGRPEKIYTALVEGVPSFDRLTIDLPIGRRRKNNSVLMSAAPDSIRPRSARTDIIVRQRFDDAALVECHLYTGRNHQIRVHLATIGHPVLGDEYYAAGGIVRHAPRLDGESPTDQRHALHASQLKFRHPILQADMGFQSEPPTGFWSLAPFGTTAHA